MTKITNWLNDKKIQYVKSVNDWKEAIQIAGQPLLQDGSITQQYIDNIIRLKEQIGPYFIIAPQIAMPHARPEQGAIRLGLSVLVLYEPVRFGSQENDPVKAIFMFSAPDNHSHIEMISQLADTLSDKQIMHMILNIKNIEDLKNLLLNKNES